MQGILSKYAKKLALYFFNLPLFGLMQAREPVEPAGHW
jgi:hypothetical protein